jgi:hypothetical protein
MTIDDTLKQLASSFLVFGDCVFVEKFEATPSFRNGYELVNGVAMHHANPTHFHVPPDVVKKHIRPGHFVELRIDSPRFSVHEDTAEKCACPSCNGELKKPIPRHDHPTSLVPLPDQKVPSRGWGEDFWVQVSERLGEYFKGKVDNSLVEARLHGLNQGDEIVFHQDNILAVHDIHHYEMVAGMDAIDLKKLAQWLGRIKRAT